MATRGDSAVVQYQQRYDPWGNLDYHTQNASSPTTLDYTGQHKDDTGLLYYHARYYDPLTSRFMSADSIVPDAASGIGAAVIPSVARGTSLTVDFHETGLALETKDNTVAPHNPQALNRYSYVLNNPLRYIDPTGHDVDGPVPPIPPTPEGFKNLNEWGKEIWGGGPNAPAEAYAQKEKLANMSDEEFEAWCNERGLNEENAGAWEERYRWAEDHGKGGATAPARKELMKAIKDRLAKIRAARERKEREQGSNDQQYSTQPSFNPDQMYSAAAYTVAVNFLLAMGFLGGPGASGRTVFAH